jgi:Leucine-rich repeat (LRR) protein
MPFDIETYLNSLPDDMVEIVVSRKGLTNLPDLSRFKNLINLYCFDNKLTSLPHLNEKLEILNCFGNQLTFLPPLNENLIKLRCSNNQLTSLPPLYENLEYLYCSYNKLSSFPVLNDEKLIDFCLDFNPIYDLIFDLDDDWFLEYDLRKLNKILKIINKFRSFYYHLKFKKRFIKWLWKSKEKQIAEKYHPKYLLENLEENTDLDDFLDNW